jgi:tetratricopeptide (TPR) repeat protein
MSQSPNKLIKFWQELKRRKTGKVIVAYAATAFIVLQLADILTPALLLPEWTTRLVTLILIIGFPIAVIFSWVFDITPEGIKKTESIEESESKEIVTTPAKRIFSISNIIIAALIVVVGILAYPKIFKKDTLETLRSSGEKISVAVMPFQNMTNDTLWNVWQDGIQANLIASLTNSEELKVRQTETINSLLQSKSLTNYASITPSIANNISRKLDANIFIYGSINQSGSTIRVNAQLIDSKTQDAFKSFQIDGTAGNILHMIDSLSVMVKNFLVISKLEKELPVSIRFNASTSSPEAFRYFIYGENAFYKKDFLTAAKLFSQALIVDSNFTSAALSLSMAYANQSMNEGLLFMNQGVFDKARNLCIRLYAKRDQMPMEMKIRTSRLYAIFFETPNEEIQCVRQLLELDDQLPGNYGNLGSGYFHLYQYDKGIPEFEKALEICNKWDSKPPWVNAYTALGYAYHKTSQYKKERRLYKKAERDFPNDPLLTYRQAVLALAEGRTKEANNYIERYKSIRKANSWSEAGTTSSLAGIYSESGIFDKAEEYNRQSLSLEPENPNRMNDLAYFLIDKDQKVNEGIEIIDKALKLSPEDYNYLNTKGWGLYKQGKYQEALEILQKSWSLRMKNAVYDHEAYLHLEAAKKAVAGQNQIK